MISFGVVAVAVTCTDNDSAPFVIFFYLHFSVVICLYTSIFSWLCLAVVIIMYGLRPTNDCGVNARPWVWFVWNFVESKYANTTFVCAPVQFNCQYSTRRLAHSPHSHMPACNYTEMSEMTRTKNICLWASAILARQTVTGYCF